MTHETNQPEKNDQRATQGLDPDRVDEPCRVVVVPLPGGQSVTVSMRTAGPLSEAEEAALGEIVQAVVALDRRTNPHGAVMQELAASSFHARRVVRWAGEPELADRQQQATRAAMDVIRAAGADRDSRFRWAEEAARLDAEIAQAQNERDELRDTVREVAELLAVPAHLLHGPTPPTVVDLARWARAGRDSFERRLADLQAEFAKHVEVHDRQLAKASTELAEAKQWMETAIDLIDEYDGPYASFEDHPKWQAVRDTLRGTEPSGWPCRCGTDETDMVHTAERCYSATEPVAAHRPRDTDDPSEDGIGVWRQDDPEDGGYIFRKTGLVDRPDGPWLSPYTGEYRTNDEMRGCRRIRVTFAPAETESVAAPSTVDPEENSHG